MKNTKFDWSIIVQVLIKILTIGLYHVEKNRKKDSED